MKTIKINKNCTLFVYKNKQKENVIKIQTFRKGNHVILKKSTMQKIRDMINSGSLG